MCTCDFFCCSVFFEPVLEWHRTNQEQYQVQIQQFRDKHRKDHDDAIELKKSLKLMVADKDSFYQQIYADRKAAFDAQYAEAKARRDAEEARRTELQEQHRREYEER